MKRRTKLLIIIVMGIFITLFIFNTFNDNKKEIMAIGDSLAYGKTENLIKGYSFNDYLKDYYQSKKELKNYNSNYCIDNLTTSELLNLLNDNNKINDNLTIKQLIAKAEIVTIGIGIDELYNKGNINTYIYNIDAIINLITSINKNQIFLIGLFSEDSKIENINNWLKRISIKYKISFIDITELKDQKYHNSDNTQYLNSQGQQKIFEKIIANK